MPEWEVGDNLFSNNASRNYKVCADCHSLRAGLRAQVSSTSAGSASYDIHLGDGTWVANIGSTSADRDLEEWLPHFAVKDAQATAAAMVEAGGTVVSSWAYNVRLDLLAVRTALTF